MAADDLPPPSLQEVLVKTSLLALNDAIGTGNFSVLHLKFAKPAQQQLSPAKLKKSFQGFADQKIDFSVIAAKPIVADSETKIVNGILQLRGHFETSPSRVTYELDLVVEEGNWKLIGLDVRVKPPEG